MNWLMRHRRLVWALTAVYWLGLFGLTHLPAPKLPKVDVKDWVAHFATYALLAMLLHLALWTRNWRPVITAAVVIGILVAYGALDETTQALVNRHPSMKDWYADAVGATVGAAIMTTVQIISRASPVSQE